MLGRREIAVRYLSSAGARLRHRAEVAAETIRVVDTGIEAGIRRRQTEADPDHAVLRGEHRELHQRAELVSARRGGVCEPGGELVAPPLERPDRARRIH